MTKSLYIKKYLKQVPLVLILIGCLSRLHVFVHNRSLFIDEANLANNISEQPYADLFKPLNYEQYAPPLFLVESKLVTEVFGLRDYTLRIIPLLCGIASIFLLWLLLKEWAVEEMGMIYALGLWSFSVIAIRYGTEFKQYSSDAFLTLLVVYLASKEKHFGCWSLRDIIFWALFGAVIIWYSMPIIFVLPGVGLYFLFQAQKKERWTIAGVGLSWVISFAVYFLMILSKDVYDSNLQDFHATYYLKIFSLSPEVWQNNVELITRLFKTVSDKTALAVGFSMLTFLMGLRTLYENHDRKSILLVCPLLLMLLASGCQLYSLIPRMTLFVLPLVMLVMALGFGELWANAGRYLKLLLGALLLIVLVNKKGYQHIYKPIDIEDIRSCMLWMERNNKTINDKVYVHHAAVPAFNFYSRHSSKPLVVPEEIYLADWEMSVQAYLDENPAIDSLWLFLSHVTQAEEKAILKTITLPYDYQSYCAGTSTGVYLLTKKS